MRLHRRNLGALTAALLVQAKFGGRIMAQDATPGSGVDVTQIAVVTPGAPIELPRKTVPSASARMAGGAVP